MSTTPPPVTVVLPAHNAEATIAQAMASTLQQCYSDFELWVLENGSTDRTAEIARGFTDRRVRVFELGPVGFQGALQFAIDNACSEWLARMDADDLMFPHRLQAQMDVIGRRPDFVLVGAACAFLTPFGHILERIVPYPSREVDTSSLCRNRFFADPATIFRRDVAVKVGGVDPEFTMGDVPLWFRMLAEGKGWEVAEPLHLYRLQPGSMSRSTEFYRQAVRARAKYAPHAVDGRPDSSERESRYWHSIAALELLAGDGVAARRAAALLEPEASAIARRLRWLSYLGRVGYRCYRWRNRFSWRHRPDWENLFAPLLGSVDPLTLQTRGVGQLRSLHTTLS